MRKVPFLLLLSILTVVPHSKLHADPPLVPLQMGYYDPMDPSHHKSPIQIPLVYQDGNTMTFATPCTGCTLQLLDAEGEVVYETTVASGTTSVILPALSGTYELRLIFGDIYFYGDITI